MRVSSLFARSKSSAFAGHRVLLGTAAILGIGVAAAPASAGIIFTGGVGETVYGVTSYGGAAAGPLFIANNVTGFNDILASPGGGYQIANPVIANNIAQTGIAPLGLSSFKIGGGNINGPFGAGAVNIGGIRTTFSQSDAALCCSASYSISSWTTNLLVTPGGFAGNLGTYLSIGGRLPAITSAAVASLVSHYYLNGVYVGDTTPLILAASGNGNTVALGGSGAALAYGPGGTFRGLAIDNLAAFLPVAGSQIKVVSTLTVYADPSSIETITPDLSLLPGIDLPTSITDVSGAVPEPASWAMMIVGFGAVGAAARKRRARALPLPA